SRRRVHHLAGSHARARVHVAYTAVALIIGFTTTTRVRVEVANWRCRSALIVRGTAEAAHRRGVAAALALDRVVVVAFAVAAKHRVALTGEKCFRRAGDRDAFPWLTAELAVHV